MNNLLTATLGGGCFWCTEACFQRLKGVNSILPGFAGGHLKNPSYKQVCSGTTGHAEVVQIKFDPNILTYNNIL
ncbi:MAG: peptide-methionine (S)-S-oxide reductase [bacterium]